MKNEELIKYIDTKFADHKELLDAKITHVMGETRYLYDGLMSKQDEMITHQKLTNGRVTSLEERSDVFEKHVCTSEKIAKGWKVYVLGTFITFFLVGLMSAWSYHKIDFKRSMSSKWGIEFKTDSIQ